MEITIINSMSDVNPGFSPEDKTLLISVHRCSDTKDCSHIFVRKNVKSNTETVKIEMRNNFIYATFKIPYAVKEVPGIVSFLEFFRMLLKKLKSVGEFITTQPSLRPVISSGCKRNFPRLTDSQKVSSSIFESMA